MPTRTIPTLLLAATLASACSGGDDSPTSPTPGTNSNVVHYTVLAASDGIGVGGSVVCAPFDRGCENGTGYAQTIRRRFQNDGRTVTFDNLSWPGAVLTPAVADLAMSLGRSDPSHFDRYLGFMNAATTHVTLFAGGNDANVIGSAVAAGRGGSDIRGYVDAQVRQWGADLGDFVNRLRSRAPNARIVASTCRTSARRPTWPAAHSRSAASCSASPLDWPIR